MTKEEKLNKVCDDFSSLPDDKQDYILGILQALVFASNAITITEPIQEESLVQDRVS